MLAKFLRRGMISSALTILLINILPSVPCAQEAENLASLRERVGQLHNEGKYTEAVALAERYVDSARRVSGEEHPEFAMALAWLGYSYQATGRYAEAEPLYQRSLTIREKALGPNHPEVGQSVNYLALLYASQGRYAEAEPLYKRSIAIIEKVLGPQHPLLAISLNNLAELYRATGGYAQAEELYKRTLLMFEKALGPDHLYVGHSLNNLALIFYSQGRYGEAEALWQRSLAIRERTFGGEHPEVGNSLNNLAELYRVQGRYAEAEPLYQRSLAIREKALGPQHPDVGQSQNNLALLYQAQGRYVEAEPLYKRSLAIRQKALGPEHPDVGISLNNLAELYRAQDRFDEAEPLYLSSLAITEKALGPDHPQVAQSHNNRALLYQAQGRYAEAEALFKRSLVIDEKALGPDHPDVGLLVNNLALLYHNQNRYAEAEPLYQRALSIGEKALGLDHPGVAASLNNLAGLYIAQGRIADAEPLYLRSRAIREKTFGPDHPAVGESLNNLGWLYKTQNRYAAAEPLFKRSLAIGENVLGADHPNVATSLSNLAILFFEQADWQRAADYWRRSTAIVARRAQRGTAGMGQAFSDKSKGVEEQSSFHFWGLIKVAHRLTLQGQNPDATREMFQAAQWVEGSGAAAALTQMAVRGAKGDTALASLVRERQDLVAEWQKRDGMRSAAAAQAPDKRNREAESANAVRLAAIDKRIMEIDNDLKVRFPDHAALARREPLSVEEVQAEIGAEEVVILFLDTPEVKPTPEETFIWVITKTDVRWVRSDLGTTALAREVAALRCGLDGTAWYGETGDRCAKLLNVPIDKVPAADDPLPFGLARAHAVYKALFGQVEDLIHGKQLLIVPTGPLTQLPFQVLVTKEPGGGTDYKTAAWLARQNAITVLPAISSLKALRRLAKSSAASRPLIGFGNPLLDGPDKRFSANARLAGTKQRCPITQAQQAAAPRLLARGAGRLISRGGLVDPDQLKAQTPLHETADELCAVAQDLKADLRDIHLGAHATERAIKHLSASGELAKYRTVHFATHGVIAGELESASEPGLILTPPDKATEDDDGYLSASEIAALKLDADWVILSACNTAAGAAAGAEALSGLARAFFYARARALLVSHWAVDSVATVKLITLSIREIARNHRPIGRAEALRRAMLAFLDNGSSQEAHPAYWAPFIVVGEGAT